MFLIAMELSTRHFIFIACLLSLPSSFSQVLTPWCKKRRGAVVNQDGLTGAKMCQKRQMG